MPKKTASRSGTQRNRPRAQKSIQVVRQTAPAEQEPVVDEETEATPENFAATPVAIEKPEPAATTTTKSTPRAATRTRNAPAEVREEPPVEQETPVSTAPRGSAAARLAARRQGQRSQLKSAATLITVEHYTYVKRDLLTIAILASVMFVAIIILYFILARGF
jgi:hypothetical protein